MIRISRNETGKAKTHLELNLANNVKDGFFKYINNKMKTKDNVGSLLNVEESLVTEDAKKAELLKTPFALVFMKTSPLTQDARIKECQKGDFPLVREHLNKLDICKSRHPDRMHPPMLIELVDTIFDCPSYNLHRQTQEV